MSRKILLALAAVALLTASTASAQTQISSGDPAEPRINAPRVVGTTPGRPFLFMVPATGEGPLRFSAEGLPDGLALDPATGVITGSVKADGTYVAKITVVGAKGSVTRNLVVIGGKHKLAQTPPMGWNSWNVWGLSVSDDKVRAAADAMIRSGLAAHGYSYVNIDDGWEAGRAADGAILTNEKFPDMHALTAYVHSLGLKIGLYSSPGPKTCGGYEGSWAHEAQDAATWAEWGFDYIKYDWCSYTSKVRSIKAREELMKPYVVMRDALDQQPRDIVYSLCQYGMGSVWEWGADPSIKGNLWRTTGDITDTWSSMSIIGFAQGSHSQYAGPGHWNDPDMLIVGSVGWGPTIRPTKLTHDEQITHITLWSLLAAPLLIGCDMANMDQFTIDVLSNEEVIEVDQDPLGRAATRKARTIAGEVWARPLWDGTQAVGVFNRAPFEASVTVKWSDLGISGSQPVRCLWRQQDMGSHEGSVTIKLPRHGAALLKVGRPTKADYTP